MKRLFTKSSLVAIILGLLTLTVFFLSRKSFKSNSELNYDHNELNETNWSIADKVLESQIFTIDPETDTILETKKGIVFQIKANSFLDHNGKAPKGSVDLEIKEAMTAYDIMKAGLTTKSDDKLLETGGMFYINVRSGDEVLAIDVMNPITVAVPNSSSKKMSLFDGQRMKDGSINWINPKEMKIQLSTVEISGLDFYPPHFIDSLSAMGFDIKNKFLTDSIYYSFSNYTNCEMRCDGSNLLYASDSVSHSDLDPALLFKKNCADCHDAFTDRRLTGPGLAGLMNRLPKYMYQMDWLKKYILNNEKMIKAGDVYANKIYKDYGKSAMTVFEDRLTEREVDVIIDYIIHGPPSLYKPINTSCCPEINPSRIHAIWDQKFNNTILATKEFEERLKTIFKTCDAGLLELYVNHLDKAMYELDSIAASVVNSDYKPRFLEFFNRRDGGVDVSSEQNKKLQTYFKEKKKIYDEAVFKAMDKLYTSEFKQSEDATEKVRNYKNKLTRKQANLLMEEINVNMNEVYRQLGKPKMPTVPSSKFLTTTISTPGWKNVDVYVYESTINRTSMTYTDKETGTKANIEYKEITLNLPDYKNYDRVVCYLLTDKLSSFQLLKNEGTLFKEKLNQNFVNSIITIGYKGDKTFYSEMKYAEGKNYDLVLAEINPQILIGTINARYNFISSTDMIMDLDFHQFELKEKKRLDKISKREEIRARLVAVIYPCLAQPAPQPALRMQ